MTVNTYEPVVRVELVAAYDAATGATKAKLRRDCEAASAAAVRRMDFEAAADLRATADAMQVTAPASTFDPHVAASDLAATYEAAALFLRCNGANLPGTVNAKRYAKLAVVPSKKVGRGDVPAWIESVVDDTPATVAELRKRWVADDNYPDEPPSAGAVNAAADRRTKGADYDFDVTKKEGTLALVAR